MQWNLYLIPRVQDSTHCSVTTWPRQSGRWSCRRCRRRSWPRRRGWWRGRGSGTWCWASRSPAASPPRSPPSRCSGRGRRGPGGGGWRGCSSACHWRGPWRPGGEWWQQWLRAATPDTKLRRPPAAAGAWGRSLIVTVVSCRHGTVTNVTKSLGPRWPWSRHIDPALSTVQNVPQDCCLLIGPGHGSTFLWVHKVVGCGALIGNSTMVVLC